MNAGVCGSGNQAVEKGRGGHTSIVSQCPRMPGRTPVARLAAPCGQAPGGLLRTRNQWDAVIRAAGRP
jgi:hypothetical protein